MDRTDGSLTPAADYGGLSPINSRNRPSVGIRHRECVKGWLTGVASDRTCCRQEAACTV